MIFSRFVRLSVFLLSFFALEIHAIENNEFDVCSYHWPPASALKQVRVALDQEFLQCQVEHAGSSEGELHSICENLRSFISFVAMETVPSRTCTLENCPSSRFLKAPKSFAFHLAGAAKHVSARGLLPDVYALTKCILNKEDAWKESCRHSGESGWLASFFKKEPVYQCEGVDSSWKIELAKDCRDILIFHPTLRTVLNGAHKEVKEAFLAPSWGRVMRIRLKTAGHSENVESFEREVEFLSWIQERALSQRFGLPSLISSSREEIIQEAYDGDVLDFYKEFRPEFDLGNRLEAIYQLGLGLKNIHEMGYVHSDVKPSNCLIKFDDFGKVTAIQTDFGGSYNVGSVDQMGIDYPLTGSVMWTAPEHWDTRKSGNTLTERLISAQKSDVFSFGIFALRLIATPRKPVFAALAAYQKCGEWHSTNKVQYHSCQQDKLASLLHELGVSSGNPYFTLIRRLLAVSPSDRISSKEFVEQWEALVERFIQSGLTEAGLPWVRSQEEFQTLPESWALVISRDLSSGGNRLTLLLRADEITAVPLDANPYQPAAVKVELARKELIPLEDSVAVPLRRSWGKSSSVDIQPAD